METKLLPRAEMKASLDYQLKRLRHQLGTLDPMTSRYFKMLATIQAFDIASKYYERYGIT